MSINIAYIKIPVVIDCKKSQIERCVNEAYGEGVYIGHEYSDGDASISHVIQALAKQSETIKKLKR